MLNIVNKLFGGIGSKNLKTYDKIVKKINDFETENLEKSISMFTHIKIRLSKNNNERICQVISPFENKKFSYIITPSGLQNTSQSI